MPRMKLLKSSVPVTFRLPRQVRKILTHKAQKKAISFSELVRHALRREIKTALWDRGEPIANSRAGKSKKAKGVGLGRTASSRNDKPMRA